METKNTQADQASKASDFQQTAPILAPSAGQRALNPNTLGERNRQLTVVGAPFTPSNSQTSPTAGIFWPLFLIIAMLLAATAVFLLAVTKILRPLPAATPAAELRVETKNETTAPKKIKKPKSKKGKRR